MTWIHIIPSKKFQINLKCTEIKFDTEMPQYHSFLLDFVRYVQINFVNSYVFVKLYLNVFRDFKVYFGQASKCKHRFWSFNIMLQQHACCHVHLTIVLDVVISNFQALLNELKFGHALVTFQEENSLIPCIILSFVEVDHFWENIENMHGDDAKFHYSKYLGILT